MASAGASGTVTVEDQRSYIKFESLRGKTQQKFTVLCMKFVMSRRWPVVQFVVSRSWTVVVCGEQTVDRSTVCGEQIVDRSSLW